ncbi:Peptidoglycan-N-acetylglucosamine deacetylase [Microbacterium oxydans]|uniref:polysaccharide deacetylase family protein n=1 Tax=Microbacterium oxydans TaxID=82380 RepID=UPI001DCD0998|nr:polysaccharide deacetylase family protein [Microbacterium oxydans]CAH0223898.1 Peptidoglycan-N-acetylglucosamine deacetylase [Microbacterium oxydans]
MTGGIRIAVAIPTYRRPERLSSLLAVLPARFAELDERDSVDVFVIDNDPDGSAQDVATAPSPGIRVTYAPEPTPGIAAARQHALDVAVEYDLLAFIDDDEVPRANWLRALVDTWRRTGAAAVAGHVHTEFPAGTDPWVLASGLFARPLRRDGESLPAAGAGNLLLDLEQVRAAGISFDTSLGLSGGEDTLFTRAIVRAGGRVVACPASVAEDELEVERATRRFALARARHHGQTQSVIELRMAHGAVGRARSRVRNLIKGVGWSARGTVRRVVGMLAGSLERRARGARDVQRGIGLVQGALGAAAPEYARDAVHGRGARRARAALRRVVRGISPVFRSVVSVGTTRRVVVLTLDDGPDPEWTPGILDELARRGATATFFVLLTRTGTHADLLRRIVAEGHEVALHGADHRRLTSYTGVDALRMLEKSRTELEQLAAAPVRWYRPPYGALNPSTWRAVRRAGMTPVLWTTSVLDGRDAPHTERLARATSGIEAGAIVLAHDSRAGAADGVDDPEIARFDRVALISDVLDEYERRGLQAVSLANALRSGRLRRRMVLVG